MSNWLTPRRAATMFPGGMKHGGEVDRARRLTAAGYRHLEALDKRAIGCTGPAPAACCEVFTRTPSVWCAACKRSVVLRCS